MKELILSTIAISVVVLLSMGFAKVFHLSPETECKVSTVYFRGSEDDLYIQPSDIGKVDLKPMPYPQN